MNSNMVVIYLLCVATIILARYIAISIELQVYTRPYFKEASAAYGEEYNSV